MIVAHIPPPELLFMPEHKETEKLNQVWENSISMDNEDALTLNDLLEKFRIRE